jgi:hypothetical protein
VNHWGWLFSIQTKGIMNQPSMLSVLRLPARLNASQAVELLGFEEHDLPVLMRTKLLKPLGEPARNGHKFFSAAELQQLRNDHSWLDRATKAVSRYWRGKNENRSQQC